MNARETEHKDGSVEVVQKFIESMGAKMDYTLAMDDPKAQRVFNAWMTAAGQHGIPTAFVVDGNGRLAWLGHPVKGLDAAVELTLAGTLDAAASRAGQMQLVREFARVTIQAKYIKPVAEAQRSKDYKRVLELVKQWVAEDPADGVEYRLWQGFYLKAMLRLDEPAALAWARSRPLNQQIVLAAVVSDAEGLTKDAYLYGIGVLEQRRCTTASDTISNYTALASAYFRSGNSAKAIELQQAAINAALADEKVAANARYIDFLREALKQYQVGKGGQ